MRGQLFKVREIDLQAGKVFSTESITLNRPNIDGFIEFNGEKYLLFVVKKEYPGQVVEFTIDKYAEQIGFMKKIALVPVAQPKFPNVITLKVDYHKPRGGLTYHWSCPAIKYFQVVGIE